MKDSRDVGELVRRWVQAVDLRSMADWRAVVREAGLSIHQMILLLRLYHGSGSGCGVHELGRGLGVSSAAASQAVDRLVQAGFVEREEASEDRRVHRVRLSTRGRQLVDRATRHRYQWVDALVDELAAEDRAPVGKAVAALLDAEQRLPDAIAARLARRET